MVPEERLKGASKKLAVQKAPVGFRGGFQT